MCVVSWEPYEKFEKEPLSWPCVSWQSIWNNWDPTVWVFMKFYIWEFFWKSVDRSQGSLKYDKNNEYVTWWPIYIFIGSRWMLLTVRKFSYKVVEKIKPHVLRLINFSRNRAVCVIMWKVKLSQTGYSAVCMLDN